MDITGSLLPCNGYSYRYLHVFIDLYTESLTVTDITAKTVAQIFPDRNI